MCKRIFNAYFSAGLLLTGLLFNVASANNAIERGAYLTAAGGCVTCHTDEENDGSEFAGGHALETPFGIFYTPNITPDTETGIGGWSEAEFVAAMREGIRPDGEHYYPAFPYASYAGITDEDARDIKAYLDSLAPIRQDNRPNQLNWYVPGRWAMSAWKLLAMPWQYPTADASAEISRGAYLVRHLGHCGECHTPRNSMGALNTALELQGGENSAGKGIPALTGENSSIASWALEELEFFLELGMLPDGDFVGSSMTAVIDDNTGLLTREDRRAIALFLQSLNQQNPQERL